MVSLTEPVVMCPASQLAQKLPRDFPVSVSHMSVGVHISAGVHISVRVQIYVGVLQLQM